ELHHQGDVGLASYFALPQLVEICINKNSLDWNFVGLCVLIEHCRQTDGNPELPNEFKDEYFDALKKLEGYFLTNFENIKDPTTLRLTLALFATVNGQVDLGKAIQNLDEDMVKDFLEQFSRQILLHSYESKVKFETRHIHYHNSSLCDLFLWPIVQRAGLCLDIKKGCLRSF